ncbi:MAG TPA: hypothetical protein PKE19_00205 [Aestuariivirga sp.]|nr:hypothetical protein [Aestuariivirga sp.]
MAHKSSVFAAFMAVFLFLSAPTTNAAEAVKVCRSAQEVVTILANKYPGIVILHQDPNEYVSALKEVTGGDVNVPDRLMVIYMNGEKSVILIGFMKGCAAGAIPIPRSVHDDVLKKIERSKV